MSEYTANEILDAIRTAMSAPRETELGGAAGMTMKEIIAALPDCSPETARDCVVAMLKAGKMEVVRLRRRSMEGFGQPCVVQGYSLK